MDLANFIARHIVPQRKNFAHILSRTVRRIPAAVAHGFNGLFHVHGRSHLEDSIKFVDYLTSQREELLSSDTSGSLSPFKRPAETKAEVPWKQAVLELLDGGGQIPLEDMNLRFGCWDNTRQLCLKMIGGMSAEDAAKEFNRIQMEEIQAYEEKQALEGGAGGE